MSIAFEIFILVVIGLVIYGVLRYVPRKYQNEVLVGFAIWILIAGYIGYSGILANTNKTPPGFAYFIVPIIVWVLILTRHRIGKRFSEYVPLYILVGAQVFRVVVEIFLHALWKQGLVPEGMTFHGSNLEIVIGLTAPILAWFIYKKRVSKFIIKFWNAVGILVLLNVVIRGVLSVEGPFQFIFEDYTNTAITVFPYSYIAGLMVPLALTLHVVALRAKK
jgi:hypothetical protein